MFIKRRLLSVAQKSWLLNLRQESEKSAIGCSSCSCVRLPLREDTVPLKAFHRAQSQRLWLKQVRGRSFNVEVATEYFMEFYPVAAAATAAEAASLLRVAIYVRA